MSDLIEDRLITALNNKARRLPAHISNVIFGIIEKMRNKKIKMYKPISITADLSRPPISSFEYFRCPKCGAIYEWQDISSRLKCPVCKRELIQAYVGAPIETGSIQICRINREPSNQVFDYFISPTSGINSIRCPRHGILKSIKAENPNRPFYSLRFVCRNNDVNCQHYDRGYCNHEGGRIFFQRRGGIKREIALPSEGMTKPFCEVIFKEKETQMGNYTKELTEDFADLIGEEIFSKVLIGMFEIHSYTLFYLLGHNYASRSRRIPAVIMDREDNIWVAKRSMDSFGLLFRLNPNRVIDIIETLNDLLPIDKYCVAHSVAHVAMKAIIRLTGLSFWEFGEAIYVDEDQIEVLIYDDSPGGIGGVETVKSAIPDFINYLKKESEPCPRACRRACHACLYVENCASLNFTLSWMASQYFLHGR
ncbi:MAG: DUF1998 domain-containing protein [Candidatus Bathyarchaeia archaeon]